MKHKYHGNRTEKSVTFCCMKELSCTVACSLNTSQTDRYTLIKSNCFLRKTSYMLQMCAIEAVTTKFQCIYNNTMTTGGLKVLVKTQTF